MCVNEARYELLAMDATSVVVRDVGPWHIYPTITNSSAEVVKSLYKRYGNRRFFYLDSENKYTELLHDYGNFRGWAPTLNE